MIKKIIEKIKAFNKCSEKKLEPYGIDYDIYLGTTPAHDLGGKLISFIHFDMVAGEMSITLEKSLEVRTIKMSFLEAKRNGLINLEAIRPYFDKI